MGVAAPARCVDAAVMGDPRPGISLQTVRFLGEDEP